MAKTKSGAGKCAEPAPADGYTGDDEAIVKHPDFYFPDGSVVIIVEKTAFRIHKYVLARHSEVFSGMWDIPQPPMSDMYDGCPTVTLADSKSDFVEVMKVMYDILWVILFCNIDHNDTESTSYFDTLRADSKLKDLINFISGILRISTKYNLVSIRKKCISVLQEAFPSTLAACDSVLSRKYEYVPSEVVRIIPLAREANVPIVLPWAFYLCGHIPVDGIMTNSVLSWRDKALCLAGKERLWEAQKTLTHEFLMHFKPAPGCGSGCQAHFSSGITWKDTEALRLNPHPLEEYKDWGTFPFQLCARCLTAMKQRHKEGREKVWERLPVIFELGTWDEITKEQNCWSFTDDITFRVLSYSVFSASCLQLEVSLTFSVS